MQLTNTPTDIKSTTTNFVNSNVDRIVEGVKSLFTNSIGDERSMSIQKVLSNYRLVDRLSVDNTTIAQIWHVKDMINQPQFASKINGAMGIKGLFKFMLTWNTTPMTQGLYILAYLPEYVWQNVPLHNGVVMADVTYLTGCPHILVNISRETSAELILPYVGETPYIPLYDTDHYAQQAGVVIFMPISRAVNGEGDAKFTTALYFAMDDVELMGMQPIPAAAQASMAIGTVGEAVKKAKLVSSGTGKISEWFNKMSPTPLTQTAGWITGGISKIADMMGWSKPWDLKALKSYINLPAKDLFQGDGLFTGVKFTMNSDSGLTSCQMGPTEEDEMSIAYFVHRSEIFDKFNISTTTTVDTRLYNTPTLPGDFYKVQTVPDGGDTLEYTAVTHLNYLSSLFTFYRGSIKMKLVPVVTRFHSARLRVVVSMRPATQTQIRDNMSYTYTAIVDLDDPDTWEFVIPYLSQNPWRDINSHDENVAEVSIFLENQLVAPTNVAQEVEVFVGVRGGDDFEVAGPTMHNLATFVNTNPNTGREIATAESDPSFSLAPIMGSSDNASQLAVGDPVRCLRPLTRRFMLAANIGAQQYFIVVNTPFGKLPTVSYDMDFVTAVSACYAFFRGGTRIYAQNDLGAYAMFHPKFTANIALTNGIAIEGPNITTQMLPISVNESTKVELPYYSPNYQTNHWKTWQNKGIQTSAVAVYYRQTPTQNTFVLRAAADDFSTGFLIGAPFKVRKVTP